MSGGESGKRKRDDAEDSGSEADEEATSTVVENAWAMKLPDFGPEGGRYLNHFLVAA